MMSPRPPKKPKQTRKEKVASVASQILRAVDSDDWQLLKNTTIRENMQAAEMIVTELFSHISPFTGLLELESGYSLMLDKHLPAALLASRDVTRVLESLKERTGRK